MKRVHNVLYNVLKEDANNNIAYDDQIKKLLGELGQMNLWINQDTYNITFETITLRILDIFRQSWYSNINNSSRLSLTDSSKNRNFNDNN